MAEIRIDKKQGGAPWWLWLIGAGIFAVLLYVFTRRTTDGELAARAEQSASSTAATAPAPVAITGATTCTEDDVCAARELCLDGACRAIDATTSACSAASVSFQTNSAEISAAQKSSFNRLARCLRADRSLKLTLEGAADQRGPAGPNDELAEKRAHAVARELTSRGVSSAQLHAVSYGENRLLCADNDESCWSKNRRTEIQPTK